MNLTEEELKESRKQALEVFEEIEGEKRGSSILSTDLFDVLVAIVNTAQTCPDRCMADVCNDNFAVHGVNLRAEMTDDEDTPVRIEKTSN